MITKLTPKQRKILLYLANNPTLAMSPTSIGELCGGKDYSRASSWACAGLKPLVEAGLAKRFDHGAYAITYGGTSLAAEIEAEEIPTKEETNGASDNTTT